MKRLRAINKTILAFARVTSESPNAKAPDRHFKRLNWRKHVEFLRPYEFKRMFRMTAARFKKLLSLLMKHFTPDESKIRKGTLPIKAELWLGMALRYLAGGNFSDIWPLFGVSLHSLYRFIWKTVDAINTELPMGIDFSDKLRLQALEMGFRSKSSRQFFEGCIGAIDGIQISIKKPQKRYGVDNPRVYWCRKRYYSVNVQAVCDADQMFTDIDIRWQGSSSDTLAWLTTDVYKAILAGKVPPWFYFVGDAAYPCMVTMLTPVPGNASDIGKWAESYNFHQSQLRINIECAFGMLVHR